MSTKIPSSWVESTFSELNQFESSTTDPVRHPQEAFELYSVPTFPTGKPELLKGTAIGSTKQAVEPNDVLVCKINPRINRVWQVGEKKMFRQIASSEWIGFRSNILNLKFYKHYFTSGSFRELICIDLTGVGGSLTRAQPKRVATFPMPVAPLNEQKRIADKLDSVLARVDACRDRLDRIPTILKRFRQSVLAAATSGQLTADCDDGCRINDAANNVFPLVPFGNLVKSIRGGSNEVPNNQISDFPLLRSSSVRQGEVDFSDVKYLTDYQSTNADNFIENGDILFTRLNGTVEYVGNCVAVANVSSNKYQYPDRIFRAKLKDIILPAYCMFAFATPDVRRDIEARAKSTAGHKRISIQDVKEIEIRLPSILEQHEIVRRVESLFAYADRLETRYSAARKQVEKLTPATLAKAFRGELVPQDPNDEPASVLLERIRAQRDDHEASKTKSSRKAAA